MIFEDVQDVEDWLAPMDYVAVWAAAEAHAVLSEADRDHCDGLIASGEVRQDAVLVGLKTMLRLALAKRYGLQDRIHEPVDGRYLTSVH